MAAEPVNARNPRVAWLRRLVNSRRDRHDGGVFVVEGPTLVAEALCTGRVQHVFCDVTVGDHPRYGAVLATASDAGVGVTLAAEGVVQGVLDTVTPQPIAAVVTFAAGSATHPEPKSDGPGVVVLVGVADPGNVGALVRTAEAAGLDAVWAVGDTADPFGPKAVRASAGSVLRVPVVLERDPEAAASQLRRAGYRLMATATGGRCVDDVEFRGATALMLGSEAHGLDPGVAAQCDVEVSIPMAGAVESLNVAVAGSVLAFELARRFRMTPGGGIPAR